MSSQRLNRTDSIKITPLLQKWEVSTKYHIVKTTSNPISSLIMGQPGISHHALGFAVSGEQLASGSKKGRLLLPTWCQSKTLSSGTHLTSVYCVPIAVDWLRAELVQLERAPCVCVSSRFHEVCDWLESYIDPFDLDVFTPPLNANLNRLSQRTSVCHATWP